MEHWGFKMATNYIYKYVRNDEIIYIGKTKNLQQRHKQHLQEAGKFLETDKLYYFLCPSSNIMDVYETALINKYHPILNKADNVLTMDIVVKEPDWFLYQDKPIKKKKQQDFTKLNLNTSINPIHHTNPFSIPNYDNIEQPLLSIAEWKLLLALRLKMGPLTTGEYIKLFLNHKGGNEYNHIRAVADKLIDKELCSYIDKNTFIITSKGVNRTPYTDEEICLMLSFTSKWTFALYPLIKEHKTIMAEDLKQNYKQYNEAKRNILDPTLNRINTIFNKKYTYTAVKQGRSIAFITFTEE